MSKKENTDSRKTVNTILSIFEDIYHKPPIQYIDSVQKKFLNKNMFRIKVKNMISCYEQILLLVDPKYIPFSFGRSPKQSNSVEESNQNSKLMVAIRKELNSCLKTDQNSAKQLESIYQVISHLDSKIEALNFNREQDDNTHDSGIFRSKIDEYFDKLRLFLKNEFSEMNNSSSNLFVKMFGIEELIKQFFDQLNQSSNKILTKLEKDSEILGKVMDFLKGRKGVKDPNFSIEGCLEQIQDTNTEIKELIINIDPSSIVKLKNLENSEFMRHPQIVKGHYANDSIRSSSFTSNYSKTKTREARRSKTPRVKSTKLETLEEKINKYITPKNNYLKRNKRTGSFSPGEKFKKLVDKESSLLNPALIYAKTDNFSNLKKSDLSFDPSKPKKSQLGPSFSRDNKTKHSNSFRGFSLSNRNLDKAKALLRTSKMKKRNKIGNISLSNKKYQREPSKPPSSMVALVSPRISPALSSENSSFLSFADTETYMAVQRYTGTTTFVKGKTTHFSTIKRN